MTDNGKLGYRGQETVDRAKKLVKISEDFITLDKLDTGLFGKCSMFRFAWRKEECPFMRVFDSFSDERKEEFRNLLKKHRADLLTQAKELISDYFSKEEEDYDGQ